MYNNMYVTGGCSHPNLRIVIYPKDHQPPHVHVLGPNAEAKFRLDDMTCFYSRGFSNQALSEIEAFLKTKTTLLMEVWNEYQE
jgi:hypothetical protein